MNNMRRYLKLERRMMKADARGDESTAEAMRDQLNLTWYMLTPAERERINSRTIPTIERCEP